VNSRTNRRQENQAKHRASKHNDEPVDVDSLIGGSSTNNDTIYKAEIQTANKMMEILTQKCSALQITFDSAQTEIAELHQQLSIEETKLAPLQIQLQQESQQKSKLSVCRCMLLCPMLPLFSLARDGPMTVAFTFQEQLETSQREVESLRQSMVSHQEESREAALYAHKVKEIQKKNRSFSCSRSYFVFTCMLCLVFRRTNEHRTSGGAVSGPQSSR
jgi:hypothetical protein